MGSEIVNASVLEAPLWQRYADQFPVRENLVYLNHAAVSPLPRRSLRNRLTLPGPRRI